MARVWGEGGCFPLCLPRPLQPLPGLLVPRRLLQELRMVHWLPHTLVRCCDFAELQQSLAQENGCAQDLLHRFLTLCASILELVRAAGRGGWGVGVEQEALLFAAADWPSSRHLPPTEVTSCP